MQHVPLMWCDNMHGLLGHYMLHALDVLCCRGQPCLAAVVAANKQALFQTQSRAYSTMSGSIHTEA